MSDAPAPSKIAAGGDKKGKKGHKVFRIQRSIGVKDIAAHDFIITYAKHLKRTRKVTPPVWSEIVKTGKNKELPPSDPDWFYIRCAAIARRIYVEPHIGVGAFKRAFGGSYRRGVQPNVYTTASGAIIHRALKALEKIRVVKKLRTGGRKLTSLGQRDLDFIAYQVVREGHAPHKPAAMRVPPPPRAKKVPKVPKERKPRDPNAPPKERKAKAPAKGQKVGKRKPRKQSKDQMPSTYKGDSKQMKQAVLRKRKAPAKAGEAPAKQPQKPKDPKPKAEPKAKKEKKEAPKK